MWVRIRGELEVLSRVEGGHGKPRIGGNFWGAPKMRGKFTVPTIYHSVKIGIQGYMPKTVHDLNRIVRMVELHVLRESGQGRGVWGGGWGGRNDIFCISFSMAN